MKVVRRFVLVGLACLLVGIGGWTLFGPGGLAVAWVLIGAVLLAVAPFLTEE